MSSTSIRKFPPLTGRLPGTVFHSLRGVCGLVTVLLFYLASLDEAVVTKTRSAGPPSQSWQAHLENHMTELTHVDFSPCQRLGREVDTLWTHRQHKLGCRLSVSGFLTPTGGRIRSPKIPAALRSGCYEDWSQRHSKSRSLGQRCRLRKRSNRTAHCP
jgi:hypothetical protein